MTDLLCFCISLHLALPGVPWVPLGKRLQCPAGLGTGTPKGSGNPPAPCELCLWLIPVSQACGLCASWLFDCNYHPLLYTGHESPEQLRAPSRHEQTTSRRQSQLRALGEAGKPARGRKSLFLRTNTESKALLLSSSLGICCCHSTESNRELSRTESSSNFPRYKTPNESFIFSRVHSGHVLEGPATLPVSFPCSGFTRGLGHCSGCREL